MLGRMMKMASMPAAMARPHLESCDEHEHNIELTIAAPAIIAITSIAAPAIIAITSRYSFKLNEQLIINTNN